MNSCMCGDDKCDYNRPTYIPIKTFEQRTVDLARVLILDRPSMGEVYTWTQALRDATDIVLAADMTQEIA